MAIAWAVVAGVLLMIYMLFIFSACSVAAEYDEWQEDTLHPQNYTPPPAPVETETPVDEIAAVAKTVWGEARGIESQMEQAAVVWCVLNRCEEFDMIPSEVVTEPNQFHYDADFPTVDDFGRDLTELVEDVFTRWYAEHHGETDVGRVLPTDYLWFGGDGERNWFRNTYELTGENWDWSMPNPYETECVG